MRAHEFGWRRLRRPRRIHDPSVPTPARMLGLLALLSLCSKVPAFIQAAGLGIALGYAGAMAVSRKGCNGYSTNGDDRPVLDVLDTAIEAPSVANLDRTLLGVEPTFFYKGEDYTGTTLPAEVGGAAGLLTETGAGSLSAAGSPLMGSDKAVLFDGTNHLEAAGASFGNCGTNDVAVSVLYRHSPLAAGNPVIFSKGDFGDSEALYLYKATTSLHLALKVGGSALLLSAGSLSYNTWYFIQYFINRDEASANGGVVYVNGSLNATRDFSANSASVNSAKKFKFGSQTGLASFNSAVAMLSLHQSPSWFKAGAAGPAELAPLAAQRFRALTGFRPQISAAGRDTAPVTFARNSNATLEKYNETTGAVDYFTVGPHWMRVERWLDDSGNVVMGYRPELAGENKCIQSEDIATTWTPLDAGDTITATTIAADATDGDHGVTQDITLTAASWVLWGEATKGNKDWVYASDDTVANATAYFDIDTPAAGTFGAGATGGVIDRGDRTLWWMTFTGTAAAHTIKVQSAHADGDKDFAGDGSTVNTTFHRTQCELGTYPSSYVATAAAAATRVKDEVTLTGLANVGGVGSEKQGAIVMDMVQRSGASSAASRFLDINDGGSASDRITIYENNGTFRTNIVGGGTPSDTSAVSTLDDGTVHRIGIAWKEGYYDVWDNGAMTVAKAPGAIPDDLDQINIGMDNANGRQPQSCLIRRIRIYRRFQHNMAALTSGVS